MKEYCYGAKRKSTVMEQIEGVLLRIKIKSTVNEQNEGVLLRSKMKGYC